MNFTSITEQSLENKVMAKKGINKFDPNNPPKFCPKCQKKGIKSKVKMRRLCPGSEKVLICKSDLVSDLRRPGLPWKEKFWVKIPILDDILRILRGWGKKGGPSVIKDSKDFLPEYAPMFDKPSLVYLALQPGGVKRPVSRPINQTTSGQPLGSVNPPQSSQ